MKVSKRIINKIRNLGRTSSSSFGRKPTLYIHAGYPKTGTTSIQQYFLENRLLLQHYGILYPTVGLHGPGHVKFAISYLPKRYKERQRQANLLCEDIDRFDTRDALLTELEKTSPSPHAVLISTESLIAIDNSGVEQLIQTYQPYFHIKVIIFLRRQDRYAESLIAQAYRARLKSYDRDEVLTSPSNLLYYQKYVNLWANHVGVENMYLREYPENARNGQLINGFLKILSLTNFPVSAEKYNTNRRLDRRVLEYIWNRSDLRFRDQTYFKAINLLAEYSTLHPVENKYRYFYSPAERMQILDSCMEGNKLLSEQYFSGKLFSTLPPVEPDEHWEPYPGLSIDQVAEIDHFLEERGVVLRA